MKNNNTNNRYQTGLKVMEEHFGTKANELIQKVKDASEFFGQVNVEFPFGDLYSRDVLDQKTRELATVAALTVQGFSLPQLKLHTIAALNCGATQEEILEIVIQMIAYCGFPAASNALFTVKSVFDEIDSNKK